jgi:hypothetical protein
MGHGRYSKPKQVITETAMELFGLKTVTILMNGLEVLTKHLKENSIKMLVRKYKSESA